MHRLCLLAVVGFRRFYDDRQVGIFFAQCFCQPEAGFGVFHAISFEGNVAYHSKQIAAVSFVYVHGLLVISCEDHFGAATHTQHLFMFVEGFGR